MDKNIKKYLVYSITQSGEEYKKVSSILLYNSKVDKNIKKYLV